MSKVFLAMSDVFLAMFGVFLVFLARCCLIYAVNRMSYDAMNETVFPLSDRLLARVATFRSEKKNIGFIGCVRLGGGYIRLTA